MVKTLILAAGVAALATSAHAVNLLCVTSNPSSKDWVPKSVAVTVDTDRLQAAVLDEYTSQVLGGPIMVDFRQTGAKRLQLKWELVGAKDVQGREQTVDFTMSINVGNGRFTYQGIGESFFVTPGSASGRCGRIPEG
ncbi:MAG: hypothetical protein AAGM84_01925 [Pseudomonadota bacterium]